MKSPVPNLVGMTILLSSSVMSSSFSSPTRLFGRPSPSTSTSTTLSLLVRGGDDASHPMNNVDPNTSSAAPAFEQATNVNAASSVSSTALAMADVSGEYVEEPEPQSSSSSSSGGEMKLSKLGPNAPPPGLLRRLLPSLPWHVLPNYLTYARCLSIPIFTILCYYPVSFPNRAPVLSVIFALASITDWLDGYLARRWDIASPFGAFLDPVADKLMVSTALILLAGRYGGIVAIPSSVIMAREVGVSALREWMAQQGKRDSVKVGMQGKVKAALTMVSLTLLLLVPEGVGLESVGWMKYFGSLGVGGAGSGAVVEGAVANSGLGNLLGPSLLMLFASAVITVTSGSVYFKAAWPVLSGKE